MKERKRAERKMKRKAKIEALEVWGNILLTKKSVYLNFSHRLFHERINHKHMKKYEEIQFPACKRVF